MWVILVGGCGRVAQPGDPALVAERAPPAPEAVEDPCARTGTWRALAGIELPGRVDHTAVWTGSEMVLWGGTQGTRSPRTDGARYQPATDRWVAMSQDEAPLGRDDHAAVWTGSEMIVWGGNHDSEHEDKLDSGGRYDPVADRWRLLPRAGLTARDDPRAVWTAAR